VLPRAAADFLDIGKEWLSRFRLFRMHRGHVFMMAARALDTW
jgi:hypothetical protein